MEVLLRNRTRTLSSIEELTRAISRTSGGEPSEIKVLTIQIRKLEDNIADREEKIRNRQIRLEELERVSGLLSNGPSLDILYKKRSSLASKLESQHVIKDETDISPALAENDRTILVQESELANLAKLISSIETQKSELKILFDVRIRELPNSRRFSYLSNWIEFQ